MCPTCRKDRGAALYVAKRDELLAYRRRYHQQNLERERAKHRGYTRRLKEEVIAAYGGACTCCGETTFEFLTVDHVNGQGRHQRQEILKAEGTLLYRWLKNHGFPQEGFRLLFAGTVIVRLDDTAPVRISERLL